MEPGGGHGGGDDELRRYLEEVASLPFLTTEDEIRLAKAMQSGDDGARRQLIESKLGLVVAIARQHEGQGLRLIDLIQEGNIWLTRAVDRYDWRKGERLSSEATRWIGRGITEALQGPMAGAS